MDPFLYQYLIGGIVFVIGVIYAHKQGYISNSPQGIRNTVILLVGLGFFAGTQAYLQYGDMTTRPAQQYPCAEATDYEACFAQIPKDKRRQQCLLAV